MFYPNETNTVCIVGAGVMGWSMAEVFATAACKVILCDREVKYAEKGKAALEKSLQKRVKRGSVTPEYAEKILSNVIPSDYAVGKDAIILIEAIYENMQAKKDLFVKMEEIMNDGVIFATNTSTLSITEMAMVLKDPSRLVGMHFFNPAAVMKLVEVIGGVHTSEQIIERVMESARRIGKVPIRVEESAGFVVNRILIPMINEAVCVLEEGVASAEDIDTAMKLGANQPMGPLALGDLIGLDVVLASMEVLFHETGDSKYRPNPVLRKMVRAGKLGRKSGEGFFKYE